MSKSKGITNIEQGILDVEVLEVLEVQRTRRSNSRTPILQHWTFLVHYSTFPETSTLDIPCSLFDILFLFLKTHKLHERVVTRIKISSA